MKPTKKLLFILSPWTISASILLGITIGLLSPKFGSSISTLARIYLDLMRMCVLPIAMTAIISSVGKLLHTGNAGGFLRRTLLLFVSGLIITSTLSVIIGLAFKPGTGLSETAKTSLGNLVMHADKSILPTEKPATDILSFVKMMIPTNPFAAASEGKNLPLVFFSILLGLSLGSARTTSTRLTLTVIEALFEAFLRMISWLLYALPIGLCCLFAGQVSHYGLEIFTVLGRLIFIIYVSAFLMIGIYLLTIKKFAKQSWRDTFSALKSPCFVALGTTSSFATIPVVLIALEEKLRVNRNITKLVVPLGVSLNPQGTTMFFSLCTLFMVQLYQVQLGFEGMLIVIFGAILTSLAVTGIPAIIALYMLGIVLDPLSLPTETALIMMLAIVPVIDPIITVVNTLANCASTAILGHKPKQTSHPTPENQLIIDDQVVKHLTPNQGTESTSPKRPMLRRVA